MTNTINKATPLHRRNVLKGMVLAGVASAVLRPQPSKAAGAAQADYQPVALPQPVPAKEGLADLGDVKLAYWDTGGTGPAVVFLHAGTGSHAVWGYQQPVFAKAGYRAISYSRRGHLGSEAGPKDNTGSGADDLAKLLDGLGVGKFHAVGVAAGGNVGIDFAISGSSRLHSLVVACSTGGVTDPDYQTLSSGLRPKGFDAMPAEFREVGPAYRAANPAGVQKWIELEHKAIHTPVSQKRKNPITFAALEKITAPTLFLAGDADLWTPPTILPLFTRRVKGSEWSVIDGAGHSPYWEQPETFNKEVLAFIGKHKG